MPKRIFHISLLACFLAGLAGCASAPPPRAIDAKGLVVTGKSLETVNQTQLLKPEGGNFRLADLKGKVLIVDFWATWCPPCRAQAPKLAALRAKYQDKGVEVIGINLDPQKNNAEVRQFIKEAGMNYPVGQGSRSFSDAFLNGSEDDTGDAPIPQLFVFARDGRLVEHLVGNRPEYEAALEKIITRELSAAPVAN
ncbi:MAG: TlpA family protein disulfide reductase [Blastocatellia bacterium]